MKNSRMSQQYRRPAACEWRNYLQNNKLLFVVQNRDQTLTKVLINSSARFILQLLLKNPNKYIFF